MSFKIVLVLGLLIWGHTVRGTWINDLIQQLSPALSDFAKNVMLRTLKDGDWEGIGLSNESSIEDSISFQQFNVSNMTLKVIKISVIKPVLDPKTIILDADVAFNGSCNVQLKWKIFPLSITRILLVGSIREYMTPIMTHPPFTGGIQISLLTEPEMELGLSSAAELLIPTKLKTLLVQHIITKLMTGIGYPNKLAIPYEKSVDTMLLQSTRRTGVLSFSIHSVEGVHVTATFLQKSGTVFVTSKLGTIQFDTQPTTGKDKAIFEENWYSLAMEHYLGHIIQFQIIQQHVLSNTTIGTAEFTVASEMGLNMSVPLKSAPTDSNKTGISEAGKLTFSYLWTPLKDIPENGTLMDTLKVMKSRFTNQSEVFFTLFLYNLTSTDKDFIPTKSTAEYLRVSIKAGNETISTKDLRNDAVVTINEEFTFLLGQNWSSTTLSIQIEYKKGLTGFFQEDNVGTPLHAKLKMFAAYRGIKVHHEQLPGTKRTLTVATRLQYLYTM